MLHQVTTCQGALKRLLGFPTGAEVHGVDLSASGPGLGISLSGLYLVIAIMREGRGRGIQQTTVMLAVLGTRSKRVTMKRWRSTSGRSEFMKNDMVMIIRCSMVMGWVCVMGWIYVSVVVFFCVSGFDYYCGMQSRNQPRMLAHVYH